MSAENDHSDQRVEGMLRQWGAEEASRAVQAGAAPAQPNAGAPAPAAAAATQPAGYPAGNVGQPAGPQILTIRDSGSRWLPLAAAVVVLALGAGLFLGAFMLGGGTDNPRRRMADLRGDWEDQQTELEDLQKRLERARQDKADLETRLETRDAEIAGLESDLEKARKEYRDLEAGSGELAEAREETEAATRRATKLQEDLKALQGQLEATRAEMGNRLADQRRELTAEADALRRDLADAQQQAREATEEIKRYAGLEERLATAVAEVARVSEQARKATARIGELQDELTRAKVMQTAMWRDLSLAYMAAAAPGEEGFAAVKAAVDRTGLLKRSGSVRKQARRESVRTAINSAEAVLTRISLAEGGRIGAARTVAGALRKNRVVDQIDRALEAESLADSVRGWLVEARLIFVEVQRVA